MGGYQEGGSVKGGLSRGGLSRGWRYPFNVTAKHRLMKLIHSSLERRCERVEASCCARLAATAAAAPGVHGAALVVPVEPLGEQRGEMINLVGEIRWHL